jgi:thiol-disulfide isomerase/thioredoxin
VLAACGAADVESSSEYAALLDERDAVVLDRDAAEDELDEMREQYDELDDRLAVSEALLAEAEGGSEAAATLRDDFAEYLTLEFANLGGLSRGDSSCVAEALVDDADARSAYLVLLDPSASDATDAETAYAAVSVVLEGCGIEVPDADEPSSPGTIRPDLLEVLGEVEVEGTPLQAFGGSAADPAVGATAPVLSGADYDGQPVRIDPAVDGPTMVVFLAHWCPHCNAEIPKLNTLRDEGGVPDGVNIVAVSTAVNPDRGNFPPDEWLEASGWTFPVLVDGVDPALGNFIASEAYGLAGVPFTTLVDGDGLVIGRWAGERTIDQISAALDQLAAGG